MNSIRANFIYNSLYQILAMIIPLVTTPYLSRILGASGIGEYSYACSVAGYFSIFIMLGINNYGNREIAKTREDRQELAKTFWSIYYVQFVMGVIVLVLYAIYCFIFSFDIISIIFILFIMASWLDINWACFGLEQFKFVSMRNTGIKILSTVLIFSLVKSTHDVWIYSLIYVASSLIGSIIIWPKILKTIGYYKPSKKDVIFRIKPIIVLFLTVIAVSLFKIMDKIMLGMITTTTEVGLYDVSEKIIAIPTAFVTSLGTVMLPRMTNLIQKKESESAELLYKSFIFSMFIVSALSFGIMGIAKEFVPLFYGDGYEKCIYIYLILLPSCVFLGAANVIRTQYLLPNGMDKVYVLSGFLGAAVNLLLNFLIIPKCGSIGAAIGTLFAEISVCLLQCGSCFRQINMKKMLSSGSVCIANGLIMFVLLYFIMDYQSVEWTVMFIKVLLGAIIYIGLFGMEIIGYKKLFKKPLFNLKVAGKNI